MANELVIRTGIKLDGSLALGSGEPLLARNAASGLISLDDSAAGNPFPDNEAIIQNATDGTKLAIFSAAGITTGTTRTYTLPNVNGTLLVDSGGGGFWPLSGTGAIVGNTDINNDAFTLNIGNGELLSLTRDGGAFFNYGNSSGVGMGYLFAGQTLQNAIYTAEAGITIQAEDGGVTVNSDFINADASEDIILTSSLGTTIEQERAASAGVDYPLMVKTTVTGTASVGEGTGIGFELGALTGSTISSVATSLTAASEDFDLVFGTMLNGALAEKLRITSNGAIGLGADGYGTVGQVLTSNGSTAAATWETPSGGGSGWPLTGPASITGDVNINSGGFAVTLTYTDEGLGLNLDHPTDNSTVLYPLTLTRQHDSIGASVGVGVGIDFNLMVDSISPKDVGSIEFIATDVDNTTAAVDLHFKVLNNGAISSNLVVGHNGTIGINGGLVGTQGQLLKSNGSTLPAYWSDPVFNTTVKEVSTTTYTLLEEDLGKVIHFTNAAGVTVTVPTGLSTGWNATLYRGTGAGTVTIASAGTLEATESTIDTENAAATILHRGSNVHVALGALGVVSGGGGGISGLTSGRIPYATSDTTIADDASLLWDATNNAMTVGLARFHTTSLQSIFIGQNAGNFTVTGIENTAVGNNAGVSLTSGNANTFLGSLTGAETTTGSNNTLIGYNTGGGASSAFNVAVGSGALTTATTGSNNIAIGYAAGNNITTGNNNIVIGHDIDAPSATAIGQLSIQNIIFGQGNSSTGSTIASGTIGIGMQAVADDRLSIRGTSTSDLNMALWVENSSSTRVMAVSDAGNLHIGGAMGFPSGPAGVIGIGNATTVPGAVMPSTGGFLYSEAGALKWKGSSGTVTTIAPA